MWYDGLTEHQCEIADMIYECETIDECKFLLDYCFTEEDRIIALTLIELMHLESLETDENMVSVEADANEILQKIMQKS